MSPGDRISWGGEVGVLISVEDDYATISVPSQGLITVPVDEVAPYLDDPAALLADGQLGDSERYQLRLQAEYLRHAHRFDPLAGLSNARVEPKHHQIYVAHRVTRKPLPRMILADEVGLGKTIEAGLILKELKAREVASRVLIAVPANLRTQWQQELTAKFNTDFMIMDGDAARHFGRDGANPFEASDGIICSLAFASRKERREQIASLSWDLVIFDEAHRVRASGSRRTQAYELADRLKGHVSGMLLLTATPMQLSVDELWALIDLVEPGLYPSVQHYEEVRARFPALNDAMRKVQTWTALPDAERARFLESAPPLLRTCGVDGDLEARLGDADSRTEVLDAISSKHHLADVLVRNRRADVGGFTSRSARRIPVEMSGAEDNVYEEVTDYLRSTYNLAGGGNNALGFLMVTYHKMLSSSSAAIYASLKRRRRKLEAELEEERAAPSDPWSAQASEDRRELLEASDAVTGIEDLRSAEIALETEIEILTGLIGQLGKIRDSKAQKLVELVDTILIADPREKILVFTQFLETQRLLVTALRARGFDVESFNGRQSFTEKDAAIERFRHGAQVLVSTEAGGEGRNLQFCHLLCNYDLPWNPMKVEQRIGRVDRIGQTKPVTIYNLANVGTIEERVLDVLEGRIRLFEESIGSLDPILGGVEQDIEQLALLARREQEGAFHELEENVEKRVREALHKEETLRDFALERNSFRQDETNELLGRRPMARPEDLRGFIDRALRYEGGVLTEEVDGRTAITLSQSLERRLARRTSTYRGTFDPKRAIREETWEFFAMGHELVDDFVALARDGILGLTGGRLDPGAPEGGGLEFFYEIAVGGLQHRGRLLRHVVDSSLSVREEIVSGPLSLDEAPPCGVPGELLRMCGEAARRSAELARTTLDEMKLDAIAELEEVRETKRERQGRVHAHRQTQQENAISQLQSTISDLEASDDEERRRILPALHARVRRHREQMEQQRADHAAALAEIEALEPRVSLRTVAAGVVMPA